MANLRRVVPILVAAVALATVACRAPQQPQQQTFTSAQSAADALDQAVKANDQPALLNILGPGSDRLVSSGDPTEDAASRAKFVSSYATMHRLATVPDGNVVLYIGAENWPFTIPLVQSGGAWHFDTAAGEREILYRRIGNNEEAAVQILTELAAAQKEYFGQLHDGATRHQYAQHLVSTPGKHDGLFWANTTGEAQSPIGSLLAFAGAESEAKAAKSAAPYQGYHFHVLKAQGPDAPGGAKNYVVDGAMTDGFAFVAWPAEYRSSGVFTFLIGPDGTIYRKNIGADADATARALPAFDPDATWEKIQP